MIGPTCPWPRLPDDATCRCGGQLVDAYTCESCLTDLSIVLGEMEWLDEQLTASISRQRGASLTGGANSGETALPYNEWASKAERRLRKSLTRWVIRCHEAHVLNSSPTDGLPRGEEATWSITAMSRWLMWRVDGLAYHRIGRAAMLDITSAAKSATRVVTWKRLARVFLGRCEGQADEDNLPTGDPCEGEVYAEEDETVGQCETCGRAYPVDARRSSLEAALNSRLVTAAEFATLSTYLGLDIPSEQIRKRVNQWHKRQLLTRVPDSRTKEPVFRYGDVRALLARDINSKKGA